MLFKHPAPLRAIPHGAPRMENRVMRIPMTSSYGGTDAPLVEIPVQVLFTLTVHYFTDTNRPAEWVVGTMEGSAVVMAYTSREIRFRAPSSTPSAQYESDAFKVEDFLVMGRHYTRRLLYDLALAS